MSSVSTATTVATATVPHPAASPRHCPRLGAVVRRVALSLLIACAIPATLFYTCFRLADIWVAIIVALGWSYGAIAWRAITRRRTSGLLVLTAVAMTGRTIIALVSNSTFLYFLQPIISDGLLGAAFLLSLATARPMVARLAGDFYPMDRELSMRPRIRRLFWGLTLLWATLCLGKALGTLWLLQSQSLETFVLVKGVSVLAINGLAVAVTIGAASVVARKEGLLGSAATGRRLPALG
jgi:intracellular septation protein A